MKIEPRHSLAALALVLAACSGGEPQMTHDVRLQDRIAGEAGDKISADADAIRRFYRQRNWQHVWTRQSTLGGATELDGVARRYLGTVLDEAESHGLQPADYRRDELRDMAEAMQRGEVPAAALELAMTASYVRYTRHLSQGALDQQRSSRAWHIPRPEYDAERSLEMLVTDGLRAAVDAAAPTTNAYRQLRQARSQMAAIADAGGWPEVGGEGLISPGDTSPHIPALRERLRISGELAAVDAIARSGQDPHHYDDRTVAAFRAFQRRHGIEDDGIIGPEARAMLNYPAELRLRQIDANLERMRWIPRDLPGDRIMVNIASQHLDGWRDGDRALSMRVIVGDERTPTPAFSKTLRYVEVNPYWTLPQSIIINETAPKVLADPNYLRDRNLRVYPDWSSDEELDPTTVDWAAVSRGEADAMVVIRQDPGPDNALGRIKFMFPNKHAIYLHDTPARHLFAEADRTFSHGCIRVAEPMELAEFILDDSGDWTADEVSQVVESRENRRIDLAEADEIPVYIYYLTAWADASGQLYFRPDHYQRDDRLIASLKPRRNG